MPHVFSQNKHPFGECGHFNQIEFFEKGSFLIMPHHSEYAMGLQTKQLTFHIQIHTMFHNIQ
jgi:hypothetical protein